MNETPLTIKVSPITEPANHTRSHEMMRAALIHESSMASDMVRAEDQSYRNGLRTAKRLCEIRACRAKEPNELEGDLMLRRREARTTADILEADIQK